MRKRFVFLTSIAVAAVVSIGGAPLGAEAPGRTDLETGVAASANPSAPVVPADPLATRVVPSSDKPTVPRDSDIKVDAAPRVVPETPKGSFDVVPVDVPLQRAYPAIALDGAFDVPIVNSDGSSVGSRLSDSFRPPREEPDALVGRRSVAARSLFGCSVDSESRSVESSSASSGLPGCSRGQREVVDGLVSPVVPNRSDAVAVEVEAERTMQSKTYRNPDGSKRVRLFGTAVHRRLRSGGFAEVNPLVRSDGKAGLMSEGTSLTARYAVSGGDRQLLSIERAADGTRFGFGLSGMLGSAVPELNSASVLYREALRGVDVQFDQNADAVKGSLVLKRSGAESVFRFPVESVAGSVASVSGSSVTFRDAAGATVGIFSVPVIFERSVLSNSSAGSLTEFSEVSGRVFSLAVDASKATNP